MTTMSKKVAIYTRVSTDLQSNDSQLFALREYCKQRGFTIYREYNDVMSGAKDSRPALNQMMEEARKHRFSAVIVYRFDRFARSTRMLLDSLETFRALKIDFVSHNEQIDTSSPLGIAIFSICAALSQLERDIIRQRVSCGVRAKMARNGGKWGRTKTRDDTKIRELRANGLSIRQIAETLKISTGSVQKALKGV